MGRLTWQSKSGLLQLHSAQPLSEAYQTVHHVGTTLGKGRCNLATGQAARRINTTRMNPQFRSLEIRQAGMLLERLAESRHSQHPLGVSPTSLWIHGRIQN
jgi:hypothetical protein